MNADKAKPIRGRPIEGREAKARYTVMLEPRIAEKLRKLGGGNLSAGIARALKRPRYPEEGQNQ